MSRGIAVLLALLFVSNAAWLMFSGGEQDPAFERPDGETQRVRQLETENAELLAQVQSLTKKSEPPPQLAQRPPVRRKPKPVEPEPPKGPDQKKAAELRKAWVAAYKQVDDPALRERALAEVRRALEAGSDEERLAALSTLSWIGNFTFDKASFKPLVRPFLSSKFAETRRSALFAYSVTGLSKADLPHLLPLASDPDWQVRQRLCAPLVRANSRELDRETSAALLQLIDDENSRVSTATLRSLQRLKQAPPTLEDRLVEIAGKKGRHRNDALMAIAYYDKKTEPMVTLLLESLAQPHWNGRFAAYHGLELGVPDDQKRRVADATIRRMGSFSDYNDHMMCMRILKHCGDRSDIPELEKIAANQMVSEMARNHIKQRISYLPAR